MREQQEQPTNVGFMCGGAARCDKHTWSRALLMHFNRAEVERVFAPMQFVYARQDIADDVEVKKHGDCYVALTKKDFVLRQRNCNIRNRDEEHDVVLLDWAFTYYEWSRGATEHTQDRRVRPRNDKARDAEHSSASSASTNASDESDESHSEAERSDEPKNAEESCDWSADSAEDDEDDAESLPEEVQEQQERLWNCAVILAVACNVQPGVGNERIGKTSRCMQPPRDLDVPEIALPDLKRAVDTLLLEPETASATEHGYSEVRRMRPIQQITLSWEDLLWWRREEEPDDTLQLSPEQIARAWTRWMRYWLYYNLRPDQRSEDLEVQASWCSPGPRVPGRDRGHAARDARLPAPESPAAPRPAAAPARRCGHPVTAAL